MSLPHGFAAPLTRGEANAVSGGVGLSEKQTPRSPAAARQAHDPLVRGSAWLFAGFLLFCLATGAQAQQHDPLRPSATFEQEPRTAPLVNAENNDKKRVRSYAMQPPTIPHKTDNYQVDRFANKCMTCHARTRVAETQATPISITHYQDRDGNFLADVSPRRYFCEQCHVVQMQTQPAVGNRFRDVESIIKKQSN